MRAPAPLGAGSPTQPMKTPPSPISQTAAFLARHAHLIALALFVAVGLAVFDDYGLSPDEHIQREIIGYAALNYVLGNEDAPLALDGHNRYYGVAVEAPLVAVERLLGLEDSRAIYLSRHLLTHLLFLAAGFFAWLLARRLFGSRLAALLAMLLFLLHPRMYAHSFFNSKDLPFLSMFMIALYLTHRAFRRDSVWAFALCGAGAGLLMNVRIMGMMLVPAVLGMLALDAVFAMSRGAGAKRALAKAAAFIAAFAAVLYAARPHLWENPLELIDALRVLSAHPHITANFFRGEWIGARDLPWDYVPTWMLITSPPAAVALAALGIACLARLCAADWRGALANSTARFGLLSAACLILPIAAAVALNSTIYDGWRHMYFLWAPACVLGAFGLSWLSEIPRPRLRMVALSLAALGLAFAAAEMVGMHPFQNDYFNPLVNKNGLAERWEVDYWGVSRKQALERALSLQPAGRVSVGACDPAEIFYKRRGRYMEKNFALIPREDRARIYGNDFAPDFCLLSGAAANPAWTLELYGETIASLMDRRDAARAAYTEAYNAAKSAKPDFEAHFDVYAIGGMLIYLREPCGEGDELGTFTASARPVHPKKTRNYMRDDGFDNKTFQFGNYGKIVGGACVMTLGTSGYPLESMRIAYRPPGSERELWSADIPVNGHIAAYETAMSAEPLARSGYDIYADSRKRALIYVKRQCADDDIRARFFMSIFPEDPADLPQGALDAGSGYRTFSFQFYRHGAAFDGKCVVVRDLPDYPIDRIETGQWIPALPGEDALWRAGFAPSEFYERRLRRAESSGEPAIRSDFDVYLEGDSLIYAKNPCAESDARGRFWLSVFPSNPADLPQDRRDAGFEHESLNFDFANYGAIFDGKCVAIRDLPDYPITRIETGKVVPGEGERWSARIPPEEYEDRFRRALSAVSGDNPAASAGGFDIYMEDRTLTYVNPQCSDADARGRFFLSVFPKRRADLPQAAQTAGREHQALNFDFPEHGATIDGDCVIIRNLPGYSISRIETGQWIPGEGGLWDAEIVVGE